MTKHLNILEFIGFEQHNTLVSIANLKGELGFTQELDEIFHDAKHGFTVDRDNELQFVVSMLFLQAHNEFYLGMSQFFKAHLGKSFFSLRMAIDAAFYCCYVIKHPKNAKELLDENSLLQKQIFWRIKDHISKNPKDYPAAQSLVKIHEIASSFSHPSVHSIMYKYMHNPADVNKKEEVQLNYFDGLDHRDFMSYYFILLKGFFMVFQIFYKEFFKKQFKIINPERDKRIIEFENKINFKGKQYPLSKSSRAKNVAGE